MSVQAFACCCKTQISLSPLCGPWSSVAWVSSKSFLARMFARDMADLSEGKDKGSGKSGCLKLDHSLCNPTPQRYYQGQLEDFTTSISWEYGRLQ
jgi:hypothetical protein